MKSWKCTCRYSDFTPNRKDVTIQRNNANRGDADFHASRGALLNYCRLARRAARNWHFLFVSSRPRSTGKRCFQILATIWEFLPRRIAFTET